MTTGPFRLRMNLLGSPAVGPSVAAFSQSDEPQTLHLLPVEWLDEVTEEQYGK